MDEEENRRFFGDVHVLIGEMSIENCLRIFDEKQDQVKSFMNQRRKDEEVKQNGLDDTMNLSTINYQTSNKAGSVTMNQTQIMNQSGATYFK